MRGLLDDPRLRNTPAAGGLLGPGGPVAPVLSTQLPQMAPPPMAQPSDAGSLLDRIRGGASSLLGGISNAVRPKAPDGYDGLLTPDEMDHARPGFLRTLLGGPDDLTPTQRYEQNLAGVLGRKQAAVAFRQQQQVLGARQQIGGFLQSHLGGTPGQQINAIRQAFAMYASVGDHESMKALSGYLEKNGGDPALTIAEHTKEPMKVDLGDRVELRDPITGAVITTLPKGATPVDPQTAAMRADTHAMAQNAAADREDNRNYTRERSLVQQYEGAIKPATDASQALQTLYSMRAPALQGNAIAQQNALLAFIKLQHPGTVVRPSEIHTYAGLLGLGDKAERFIKNLESGQPLSQGQILSIYRQVGGLHTQWQNRFNAQKGDFVNRAKRYNIDPAVFTDPFGTLPHPAAPAPGSAGSVEQWLPTSPAGN